MITEKNISKEIILTLLEEISDPEIPVISIVDLGIVRNIFINKDEIEVVITSTYSGCPAMDMIRTHIRLHLLQHGFHHIKITEVLSPAWTTDWMSETARQKLKKYGIAPPSPKEDIHCPLCNSTHVKLVSQFGSTPCKALYQCNDCKEPFDYFKCH